MCFPQLVEGTASPWLWWHTQPRWTMKSWVWSGHLAITSAKQSVRQIWTACPPNTTAKVTFVIYQWVQWHRWKAVLERLHVLGSERSCKVVTVCRHYAAQMPSPPSLKCDSDRNPRADRTEMSTKTTLVHRVYAPGVAETFLQKFGKL